MVEGFSPPWARGGFAPGTRVASYQLMELVGRGGMAVVYKAHDDRLNRQVALKILDPALSADDAFRQRFIRESRTAASVEDPNIIPVYEAGEADGVLFIAMRLVRGGNLRGLVTRSGPLTPGRTGQIISAVSSALDAAHAAGLVHRDVKPANILLETRPGRLDHLYLSDFGLSKAALGGSSLTGTGMFLGTADYAAPEQIQGLAVDGRTDQYALGCTAFELLCGQPPFLRDQGIAAIYAHLSEPPPQVSSIRPGLPAAVDAVFARVLAKSPAERYETCQEFAEALQAALGVAPAARAEGVAPAGHPATELATPLGATGDAAETGKPRSKRRRRGHAAEIPAEAALVTAVPSEPPWPPPPMPAADGGWAEVPAEVPAAELPTAIAAAAEAGQVPDGTAREPVSAEHGHALPGQASPPAVSVPGLVPAVAGGIAAVGLLKADDTVRKAFRAAPSDNSAITRAAEVPEPADRAADVLAGLGQLPEPSAQEPSPQLTVDAAQYPPAGQYPPGGQPPYQPGQPPPGPPQYQGAQQPYQQGQPGYQPYPPGQPPNQQGQGPYPGQPGYPPGQPPYQPGQPPYQPYPPGQPPYQQGQPPYQQPGRPRGSRKRPLAWISVAAIVVIAGIAIGLYLLHRQPATSGPSTVSTSFSHQYGSVQISETWTLTGQGQSTLAVRITAHSTASTAMVIKFVEPIPAAVAPVLQRVAYSPRPVAIVAADRVVQWDLSLPPSGSVVVSYKALVSKPATRAALNDLVAAYRSLGSREAVTVIPPTVTSLTITPAKVKLAVGHSYTVKLSGVRSDGSNATAAMLSKAVWTTSKSRVAVVAHGKITAKGPGTATITAQIGGVKATVRVTVAPRPAPTPVTYPSPAPTSTYAPPPPPPSGTPTPTLP